MPHPSPLTHQRSLIALLLVLLGCRFLATFLASYYSALDLIRALYRAKQGGCKRLCEETA